MKKLLVVFFLLAPCTGLLAKNNIQENDQLRKASMVINEIMQTPDKGIPKDLLNKAVCVGVVPSELKAAFVVGGTYGRGVLVCRKNGTGPWGAPSLFTLGGASVGFQIGGKATDVVFLVMNPRGINKLLQDKVKLGADLSVAAGPVGRTAAGETDAELRAEILSYSRSRGAFAGISLNGSVLKQDTDELGEGLRFTSTRTRPLAAAGVATARSVRRPDYSKRRGSRSCNPPHAQEQTAKQ